MTLLPGTVSPIILRPRLGFCMESTPSTVRLTGIFHSGQITIPKLCGTSPLPWGGAFHQFEMGKSYNFFLIYACGIYSWRFFRGLRLDRRASLLLAACTSLNPVAVSQILTFYVDGAMASLLGMLFLSGVAQLYRPARLDRVVFVAVAAACATTKFTGAVYVCVTLVLVFAGLVVVSFRGSRGGILIAIRPMLATIALVGVIILVLGFSPYVTNVLQGYSPNVSGWRSEQSCGYLGEGEKDPTNSFFLTEIAFKTLRCPSSLPRARCMARSRPL